LTISRTLWNAIYDMLVAIDIVKYAVSVQILVPTNHETANN
jgi:hypothetical protein